MSNPYEKLLELNEIQYMGNQYFLHLRLSFMQDIDLLWKIDAFTAENLKTILALDSKYKCKYRLSFSIPFDSNENQSLCSLTRTFREESESFYYLCSEEYMKSLKSIKNCKDLDELDPLVFSFPGYVPADRPVAQKIKPAANILLKNPRFKMAFISLCTLGIILATSYDYLEPFYSSKPNVDKSASIVSIDNDITPSIYKVYSRKDEIGILDDSSSHQPTIPFLELESQINARLPEGKVALTFDDGPSIYSKEIVDILKDYDVGATFFFVGQHIKNHPEYVEYIHSNGYSIGNHSMNHIDMTRATGEDQRKEIHQCRELIEEITGEKVVLFRPPYGFFNEQVEELMVENQYKMVLWSNDPKDWKVHDEDKIIDHIKNTDVSGSIILLHENKYVVQALPEIIQYLQKLDLEVVNLK